MRLSSHSSNFIFSLPSDFIPLSIIEQYSPVLEKNFVQYSNIIDYLNSTIKAVTIPGLSIDTPSQSIKRGKKINYKPVTNINDILSSSEITVEFRSIDGDLNYFIMWDIFIKHYLDVRHVSYIAPFSVTAVDIKRDAIYDIKFREIIAKTLSEIRMSYSEQKYTDKTFTVNFSFNWYEMDFKINPTKILEVDNSLMTSPRIISDPTTSAQFPSGITSTFSSSSN
jgi:hypothetical protein